MTLPATPTLQQANVEMGRSAAQVLDMNDSTLRDLAKVSLVSGTPWQMSSLAGKTMVNLSFNVGKDPSFAIYGYNSGSPAYGSVSPTGVLGGSVRFVAASGDGTGLQIGINGALVSNFFTTVLFRDSVNSAPFGRLLTTNAITFDVVAGIYGQWNWDPDFLLSSRFGQTIVLSFIQ